MQQLKLWQQREKEWARAKAKREKSNKRSIYFSDSVMLLEAAARNDIDEGDYRLHIDTNIYHCINIYAFVHNRVKTRTYNCMPLYPVLKFCQKSTKRTS